MSDPPVRVVLFDRDGTLIAGVRGLHDPAEVTPVPHARAALDRLRRAGIFVGVLTNQPGIAEGSVSWAQLTAVHQRMEDLLGPFDVWGVCPHVRGCSCRMPKPGLVRQAMRALAVRAGECLLVGATQMTMETARNAGAPAVLVSGETDLRAVADYAMQ
ncbi:HAD-IIIA family hydrolase [Streptosporangiaceae bacterium NEAU-GS5]|nr:HAD-IIIA family hydrolase [Streptosporangiaceae bacterium NEAU-GS5]